MGIIDDLLGKEKSNVTGWLGETFTEFELMIVKLFGRDGKMLRNVYIPKEDGTYSEIDVLYITKKGIFVLESKNYSGWIFGDAYSKNWTACLSKNQKNQFYNPIKQNETHIKWLKKYVNDSRARFFSIIVFSDRCELKKVPQLSDVPVINRRRLYSVMKNIWDSNPDIFSNDDVIEIWLKLNDQAHQDDSVKKQHIENIKGSSSTVKTYTSSSKEYTEHSRTAYNTVSNSNTTTYKATSTMTSNASTNSMSNGGSDIFTAPERSIQGMSGIFDDFYASKLSNEKSVCPRCGSELVIRTARKGEHKFNKFYGCSNFPKCRFIKNI